MTEAITATRDGLIGARIDGRYTVHRELGRGGMGVVYEGVHDELGRPVAIKVLNTAWASDPTAVARFLREARTASSFSHGNIVDVSDLGRLPDGRPFLVMPKITGVDLASLLANSGAQPAKRVAELLSGVAAALDVIHAKGFVHRDIKPENLMYVVREDGSETVMLLDFGIAAALMSNEPRLTGQGSIFGTPQFMPPEVCGGGMPDARGDVYALATVAFELITGQLPFGGENMMRVLTAKLTSDPPTLAQVTGVPFPPELEAVIALGLARAPEDRIGSASEFVAALKASTEHAPVSWRSGVLRASLHSDAHPVANHDLPNTASQRSTDSRPRSGSPRTNSPWPTAPGSSPAYAGAARAESARSQSPRSQPVAPQPWAAESHGHDAYPLGAGLRESERRRTAAVRRSRNSLGMLLGLAGAIGLAVVLWVRQDSDPPAAASGMQPADPALAPSGAVRPQLQPGVLAPAASQLTTPEASQPTAADPAPQRSPSDPGQAPSTPVPALPVTPTPGAQAEHGEQLPSPTGAPAAPVTSGTRLHGAPSVATRPPGAVAPKPPPSPATGARPPTLPRSKIPVDPPAPDSELQATASDFSAPEESPVLRVEEEQAAEEAEPELPVRPPEVHATQLARDAVTALLAGEVGHAIELASEATQLDPDHALAWRTLGLAYERSGKRSAAIRAYEQYIQLAPHGPQSDMVRERMRGLE